MDSTFSFNPGDLEIYSHLKKQTKPGERVEKKKKIATLISRKKSRSWTL
jgi:hypothetical protein